MHVHKSAGRSATAVLVAALAAALAPPPAAADLDVAFVLDTTGSMTAELREAQERIRQLAVSLGRGRPGERLRFAIVAFRDRGDDYVTRVSPLTADVAVAGAFLDGLEAAGGGDGPEAVVAALAAALRDLEWDRSQSTERQVFLVGDAPPHLDYADDPRVDDLLAEARRDAIAVHAIGCRSLPPDGVDFFRRVAYATEGSYQHIGRVEGADAGALTETLAATASAGVAADAGAEVTLTRWDGPPPPATAEGPAGGVLVRRVPPGVLVADPSRAVPQDAFDDEHAECDEEDPGFACPIELALPAGVALAAPPRARLAADGLHVTLVLADGPSDAPETAWFLPERCPALPAPVHVHLAER